MAAAMVDLYLGRSPQKKTTTPPKLNLDPMEPKPTPHTGTLEDLFDKLATKQHTYLDEEDQHDLDICYVPLGPLNSDEQKILKNALLTDESQVYGIVMNNKHLFHDTDNSDNETSAKTKDSSMKKSKCDNDLDALLDYGEEALDFEDEFQLPDPTVVNLSEDDESEDDANFRRNQKSRSELIECKKKASEDLRPVSIPTVQSLRSERAARFSSDTDHSAGLRQTNNSNQIQNQPAAVTKEDDFDEKKLKVDYFKKFKTNPATAFPLMCGFIDTNCHWDRAYARDLLILATQELLRVKCLTMFDQLWKRLEKINHKDSKYWKNLVFDIKCGTSCFLHLPREILDFVHSIANYLEKNDDILLPYRVSKALFELMNKNQTAKNPSSSAAFNSGTISKPIVLNSEEEQKWAAWEREKAERLARMNAEQEERLEKFKRMELERQELEKREKEAAKEKELMRVIEERDRKLKERELELAQREEKARIAREKAEADRKRRAELDELEREKQAEAEKIRKAMESSRPVPIPSSLPRIRKTITVAAPPQPPPPPVPTLDDPEIFDDIIEISPPKRNPTLTPNAAPPSKLPPIAPPKSEVKADDEWTTDWPTDWSTSDDKSSVNNSRKRKATKPKDLDAPSEPVEIGLFAGPSRQPAGPPPVPTLFPPLQPTLRQNLPSRAVADKMGINIPAPSEPFLVQLARTQAQGQKRYLVRTVHPKFLCHTKQPNPQTVFKDYLIDLNDDNEPVTIEVPYEQEKIVVPMPSPAIMLPPSPDAFRQSPPCYNLNSTPPPSPGESGSYRSDADDDDDDDWTVSTYNGIKQDGPGVSRSHQPLTSTPNSSSKGSVFDRLSDPKLKKDTQPAEPPSGSTSNGFHDSDFKVPPAQTAPGLGQKLQRSFDHSPGQGPPVKKMRLADLTAGKRAGPRSRTATPPRAASVSSSKSDSTESRASLEGGRLNLLINVSARGKKVVGLANGSGSGGEDSSPDQNSGDSPL